MSPTPTLSALLSTPHPIILDGALATYLEVLGATLSSTLWSASLLQTNPDIIRKAHTAYYTAGVNIAITASYQASIPGLVEHLDVSSEVAEALVGESVELAKRAREECIVKTFHDGGKSEKEEKGRNGSRILLVAGSVGPYGAYLADGSEYTGSYALSRCALKTFHRGRIAALVASGVDVLACETIPSMTETEALVELLRDEFPGTEAWVSWTLRDSEHISDGTALSRVAEILEGSEQVVAIGVNCVGEEMAVGAIKHLAGLTKKGLVAYPNSGEQWDAQKRDWQGERYQGKELADRAQELWEAGARIIGGCCRTTPDDIRVIAERLNTLRR